MEEFYAILREFTELYKNIGEIKRKEMSSNIDIKRICAWCKQEFIAHKTTTTCCSHRYAVIQISLSTDIYTVSKMLTHKNVTTTQIYADLVNSKKRETANKMSLK